MKKDTFVIFSTIGYILPMLFIYTPNMASFGGMIIWFILCYLIYNFLKYIGIIKNDSSSSDPQNVPAHS